MGTNNTLFRIIKSMSMNEKRSFKIFCKKHILGDQNKYSILFDSIDNSVSFNEHDIKNTLLVNGYSDKYFSSDKNYLIKTILKSLNEFHAEKTSELKIKQNLISIEILFYKGLYEECLNLINKTKRIKLSEESQYLKLELNKWEKKCLGYSKGLLEAIKTNNLLDNYFEVIKYEKLITDLYYKSYYYKNSIGKIPQETLEKNFKDLFKSSVFKNPEHPKSIHINIFFYLIYANYYHVIKERDQELVYLRKVIGYFDDHEIYKNERPLDYISIYIRIIDINKNKIESSFYEDLNTLRRFDNILKIQYNVAKERIFLHTYQAELEHLLNFNQVEKAFKVMTNMQLTFNEKKFNIEPYYLMSIHYLFASIHCSLGDFSKGLKYVNTILNEFKFNERPKTYIKTEFLNLVIHYELNNYDLVRKGIGHLKKKYKKGLKLNYIEKEILKTILKIIDNPNIINKQVEFFKLNTKIHKKIGVNANKPSIENNYLRYILLKAKSSHN